MREDLNLDRRRFFGKAAMTIVAAELGTLSAASAQSSNAPVAASANDGSQQTIALVPASPKNTSFASLKQVNAGVLNIGYAEDGPADGQPVILLHGWPFDIHAFVDVAPLLAKAGYRVIVPYQRGYGSTTFLSADTFRNAQQSICGEDVVKLMDALKIKKAIIGGFDIGSRTAAAVAILWPDRVKALVLVSGYLIANVPANKLPAPPKAEYAFWYQWYFSTQRGLLGYTQYTYDFNKLVWAIQSPKWQFGDATYDRTAAAFKNPDHVAIVIHNYRWRIGLAAGDSKYDSLENKLFEGPAIDQPTITIASDFDGPNASALHTGVSSRAGTRTRSLPASATMCLKRRRKRFRTRSSRWPAIRQVTGAARQSFADLLTSCSPRLYPRCRLRRALVSVNGNRRMRIVLVIEKDL